MQSNARNFQLKLKKTAPKRNIVIAVSAVIVVALILAAIFFWPRDRSKVLKVAGGEVVVKEKPPLPKNPEITEVRLTPPAPTSQDSILAQPVLKYPDMKFVKYSYQWYVNGDSVSEVKGDMLENKYFKKGDTVFCRIGGIRGKIAADPVDSDEIRIGNAPPHLNPMPVPVFDIPGEFRYTINAEDPDGDPLTYRLLDPQEPGASINSKTGMIKLFIDAAAAEPQEEPQLQPEDEEASSQGDRKSEPESEPASPAGPNTIRIAYEVSDTDGASVTGSIELILSKGTASEIPQ
jgi:hypothetical protein